MTYLPVRQIGQLGIITDISPQELPLNAWSNGRNVSFKNGKVSRSPVFKGIGQAWTLPDNPVFVANVSSTGVAAEVLVVGDDGSFTQFYHGTPNTSVGPSTPFSYGDVPITHALLGQCIFLNNHADVPIMRPLTDPSGTFTTLANWPTDTRAYTLRAFKDFLIALNVTKTSADYPNMIKWSDVMQAGSEPSWNLTALNSLAGENVLNDATGRLIDGVALGNSFFIYGSTETYRMDYVGESFVFAFDKVFHDLGVISQNCVVEVDGKHFVFGTDDIITHDGTSKISIADSRVRRHIFSRLDVSESHRCFVSHDSIRSEVMFCYPSRSDGAHYSLEHAAVGCNEAAVFNYRDNTWTFIDLPYVIGSVEAAIAYTASGDAESMITWGSTLNWNSASLEATSWFGAESKFPSILGFVCAKSETLSLPSRMVFYDAALNGHINNPIERSLLVPAYAETVLRDGDNFQTTLNSLKLIRAIYPQVEASQDAEMQVSVGSAMFLSAGTTWGPSRNFRPNRDLKCDFRTTGRYISIRFYFPAGVAADLTGFDMDYIILAAR